MKLIVLLLKNIKLYLNGNNCIQTIKICIITLETVTLIFWVTESLFISSLHMSIINIIMGEFLVSKEGICYLLTYGSQVFNLNLVMSGIVILLIVSYLMYLIVSYIEKMLIKND